MSARVGIGDKFIYMTNTGWSRTVEDAIAVAKVTKPSTSADVFIARLEKASQGFFPGYDPDFDELFPTLDEKKFWTTCFLEAGRWIALGKLPHDLPASPARRIFQTCWCGELLRDVIRNSAPDWLPQDEDTQIGVRGILEREQEYKRKYGDKT